MPFAASSANYGPRADLLGALHSVAPLQDFAATKILPPMPTATKEGRFHRVSNGKAYRLVKTKRAPGGAFARVATPLDVTTFVCEERGAEEPIDRTNKNVFSSVLPLDVVAARTAYSVVAIDHEVDVANAIYNESTFPASGTTGKTLSTPWSTVATATPIADLADGINAINLKVGMGKNTLIANDLVLRNIWRTADVRNAIRNNYGRYVEGQPQLAALADVLGVDGIIVASATYNSANANQNQSMARIWSNTYAFLARISDDPTLMAPQLGRTFVYNNAFDRNLEQAILSGEQVDDRFLVEMYGDDTRDSDIVRVREFTDELIFDANCGYLFKTVT